MLKQIVCSICCVLLLKLADAHADSSVAKPVSTKTYQASAEKVFDLVHTKLDVQFDYTKSRLQGKAWITLHPHFYNQDSLILDAKGMYLHKITLDNAAGKPLAYTYPDSLQLHIALDRTYRHADTLTVYIEYTARPNEIVTKGSAAITNAKGLYFINPAGKDSKKPTQIWTQGETEANSCWMPTIDKPNQKTTQEISMTVPAKYTTLSNGLLISQTDHKNGTRTDHWKQDQPHAPYLFFMGVGIYTVIKEKYNNIPVEFYVEPAFVTSAMGIYGNTVEMLALYSRLLGVEYPWAKYAQISGHDYVSGAMENTGATLHSSLINKTNRELLDENAWEKVIAHEIFHQWFGDLVTAESWSNLTVNESMAKYGEYLWEAHKYGADAAGFAMHNNADSYLKGKKLDSLHLVRFHYNNKEDMFDLVSYQKGGTILHMLRNVVGDSAFFKGLNVYLTRHRYQAAEAHHLRLAMEEVTGKDLNFFFNQWYFNYGHPKVTINNNYNIDKKELAVTMHQTQKHSIYTMPIFIDIYQNGTRTRHKVWMQNEYDTFVFKSATKPDLVNVDGDRIMLWQKTELGKTTADYITQYAVCNLYADRREAIDSLIARYDSSTAIRNALASALADPYYGIRKQAIRFFHGQGTALLPAEEAAILKIAQQDANFPTRAAAIDALANMGNQAYKAFFATAALDSSYAIAGAGLEALANTDEQQALAAIKMLKGENKGRLAKTVTLLNNIVAKENNADSLIANYKKWNTNTKKTKAAFLLHYANRITNTTDFKNLTGPIIDSFNTTPNKTDDNYLATANALQWLLRTKKEAVKQQPNKGAAKEQLIFLEEKMRKYME